MFQYLDSMSSFLQPRLAWSTREGRCNGKLNRLSSQRLPRNRARDNLDKLTSQSSLVDDDMSKIAFKVVPHVVRADLTANDMLLVRQCCFLPHIPTLQSLRTTFVKTRYSRNHTEFFLQQKREKGRRLFPFSKRWVSYGVQKKCN